MNSLHSPTLSLSCLAALREKAHLLWFSSLAISCGAKHCIAVEKIAYDELYDIEKSFKTLKGQKNLRDEVNLHS